MSKEKTKMIWVRALTRLQRPDQVWVGEGSPPFQIPETAFSKRGTMDKLSAEDAKKASDDKAKADAEKGIESPDALKAEIEKLKGDLDAANAKVKKLEADLAAAKKPAKEPAGGGSIANGTTPSGSGS